MTVPSPTLDRIPITDCCLFSFKKIQPSEINDFSIIVFLNLDGGTNEVLCKFYYQIN
jgi:hypothetical protein